MPEVRYGGCGAFDSEKGRLHLDSYLGGSGTVYCKYDDEGMNTMKFFIDTANVDEIRRANDMGVIAGVTTNPSLIAKEGRDYAQTLAEIASIVDGPISGEVKATTTDAETMIKEGQEIFA